MVVKDGSLLNCVRSELNDTHKFLHNRNWATESVVQTHLIRGLSVFSLKFKSMIDKYCMTQAL